MKNVLLAVFVMLISENLFSQKIEVYQTDNYNGIKRSKTFFVKDSLLFYSSNEDMSGCRAIVLKYHHSNGGKEYYVMGNKAYALLSGAAVDGLENGDSLMFSIFDFCKHRGAFSDQLTINDHTYKLDSSGSCKIRRKELFADAMSGMVRIKFSYLGIYEDSVSIKETDNLVMIFFHHNSGNLLKDVQDKEYVGIVRDKDEQKRYLFISKKKIPFRRIAFSESDFSKELFQFLESPR